MKPVTTVLFALLMATWVWPQGVAAPKALIPLVVTDSHHRLVSELTSASVVMTDDKTAVTQLNLMNGASLPLELGILIDASNSERDGSLKEIIAGAKVLVKNLVRGPEDRIFFLTFAIESQATGWLRKEQLAGVSINLKLGGATALYDAVAMACKERMGPRDWSHPTRRILVVISDGDDNMSHVTRNEAISQALESGVVVFTLSTQTSGMPRKGDRVLENWAKTTGGEFFADLSRKEITKTFARIEEVSDGMYYASYVPPASNTRIHEVEVKPALKEKFEMSYPKKYLWIQ